ncbi:MAG: tannase/feruloyl esterase family alpha/beta hydrolase [Acidobacteriia bacterium]|nr:tannase/feruloyl esterase family alpha/beta hydrolase [Terriglobia bacterium]
MRFLRISSLLLPLAAWVHAAATTPGSCESLAGLSLPGASITMAQGVAAGGFSIPAGRGGGGVSNLPAFCRVTATLKPSADSEIKMELWLPASGWNGKFEANGNGGWNGSISPVTLAGGLTRGYASAMSDLGHEGGSASFALGHPEKLVDFGYRAAHEMTVASKAIVAAYYGQPLKESYWTGCSAGGRSALMEAQRYPADFDGIVAGSPGLDWTGRALQAVWIAQAAHKTEASYIPPSKYALIHNAVLQACDAKDGVKDGVLEDPTACGFDPKELECKGADAADCLTAPQVETARTVYSPVLNPRTKQTIFPGFERGSETGWATMAGPQIFGIGSDLFKFVVFQDPNWDYRTFDFDRGTARTEDVAGRLLNAEDPNLKAFMDRGGKLIQYHGWADPQIAPGSSVRYYKKVLDTMGGAAKVQSFYRLFMVPGMAHCGGGDGTSNFDMLAALEQWKEQGKAPEQVPASRMRDGKVDRTRPLCPYPQVAKYKGSGSTDDAANFVCAAP